MRSRLDQEIRYQSPLREEPTSTTTTETIGSIEPSTTGTTLTMPTGPHPRTVLITGCSAGGIGSALALAFSTRAFLVIATARDPRKMSHLSSHPNIHLLSLDVTDATSIASCVASASTITGGGLDILVNNAGRGLSKPLSDTSLAEAREVFETNVFGALGVTNALLPLLLASATHGQGSGAQSESERKKYRPMIVNNTSIVSVIPLPWQGVYNASKAALAGLTDTLRLELQPLGVDVVDLKTGAVRSKFFENVRGLQPGDEVGDGDGLEADTDDNDKPNFLPPTSIYAPASPIIARVASHIELEESAMPVEQYAEQVVNDLLRAASGPPPVQVWRGTNAKLIWFGRRFLPFTAMDGSMRKMGRLDEVKHAVKGGRGGVRE